MGHSWPTKPVACDLIIIHIGFLPLFSSDKCTIVQAFRHCDLLPTSILTGQLLASGHVLLLLAISFGAASSATIRSITADATMLSALDRQSVPLRSSRWRANVASANTNQESKSNLLVRCRALSATAGTHHYPCAIGQGRLGNEHVNMHMSTAAVWCVPFFGAVGLFNKLQTKKKKRHRVVETRTNGNCDTGGSFN